MTIIINIISHNPLNDRHLIYSTIPYTPFTNTQSNWFTRHPTLVSCSPAFYQRLTKSIVLLRTQLISDFLSPSLLNSMHYSKSWYCSYSTGPCRITIFFTRYTLIRDTQRIDLISFACRHNDSHNRVEQNTKRFIYSPGDNATKLHNHLFFHSLLLHQHTESIRRRFNCATR